MVSRCWVEELNCALSGCGHVKKRDESEALGRVSGIEVSGQIKDGLEEMTGGGPSYSLCY